MIAGVQAPKEVQGWPSMEHEIHSVTLWAVSPFPGLLRGKGNLHHQRDLP